jgi:arginyl-tRNA synthetase
MNVKEYLKEIFSQALVKIEAPEDTQVNIEYPKNPEHGDYAFTGAMPLARAFKSNPREIATNIINAIEYDDAVIDSFEIAGPGFINIRLKKDIYSQTLKNIISAGEKYGSTETYKGKKVNIEYVSANPTGLLHLGHGRNACIGDTVANLYKWRGAEITREYYFNNAGNQMNNLGKSIIARYMQKYVEEGYPFPEDGYHGEYVKEVADKVHELYPFQIFEYSNENMLKCRKVGEEWCFDKIKKTLHRLGINQDKYYNEQDLFDDGHIAEVIEELKKQDLVYEKEGATWFRLTKLGLENDRVVIKSTGEATYRLPDLAYHREKFKRGFDEMVDVFGTDHIATVPDVLAGIRALGYDSDKVNVLLHQFVTLTDNGEQVKMSKRTGKSYTLDELLDEVGPDVVRFFFIMRAITTHLEFDLALAKEQSDKNPVFYLQYAHARACSVIQKSEIDVTNIDANLSLLQKEEEIALIKELGRMPEVVENSGSKHEPQILAEYLREVAAKFHVFYHECRIIGEEEGIMKARLALLNALRQVLKNGLEILGISAPEKM